MARSGLEPRISNLQTKAVPIGSGGCVLIVRVPRSYSAPRRVIFRGRNRFWARSSAGKYEPNVEELRAMFFFAPQLAERMREFRLNRVAHIAAGDTPVPLLDDCCLVSTSFLFRTLICDRPFPCAGHSTRNISRLWA